ncbi:MAG: ketosynthase chain-length factor [Pseudonocardiales bacterium]|nr:MAG: ketosynthase chain-length factor [Pseudonocardiales bacterium]
MSVATVVTGLGVVAPNGLGVADYWSATRHGDSGIGPITRFDARQYPGSLAGEISDFRARDHLSSKLITQTDRTTQFALAATEWALSDAAVDTATRPKFDMGVVTAACAGGFDFGFRELEKMWSHGPAYVSAYQSIAWFYAVNTGQISIRHGMCGPSGVLVSEHAGGLDAIAQARRQIRKGTGLIVTGGMGGALSSWGWVAQWSGGRLSEVADAYRAYLPFDSSASGYVPGEGGAMLILENADIARERSAPRIYGEIAGYAATFDPRPGTGREPGLRRAIELALADAGLTADDIDVVFADAAGSPSLDRLEADAIIAVFGPGGVPVTAPKTMTGRLYSGSGPLDVATALLSIEDGVIPPTVNVRAAPEYQVDLVTGSARAAELSAALVLGRGRGGFNAAMVLRSAPEKGEKGDHQTADHQSVAYDPA